MADRRHQLARRIHIVHELISLGVVKMEKIDDHMLKLQRIFEKTVALIDNYHPDCLAIEAPFYGKNIQVMLKLGRAQGIAMAAALSRNGGERTFLLARANACTD